jgi:hypothetical protein
VRDTIIIIKQKKYIPNWGGSISDGINNIAQAIGEESTAIAARFVQTV